MLLSQSEKIFTVSEALTIVRNNLEHISIVIEGELSKAPKVYPSSVYFTIKDEGGVLDCLMWRNNFNRLDFPMEEGKKYRLKGKFSIYLKNGSMKFYADRVELAGEGQLRMQVAALAKKLKDEGLMADSIKKPLPQFPEHIGLVTSGNGSVVHDVLRTLRRRFPLTHVLFAGVKVEGKGAVESILSGIDAVEAQKPEVILLVRGGGSFEDLMPFNDERLARRIRQSTIPIVTGLGHEVDNSIADMVADVRASTPTAAAETISPEPGFLTCYFDRNFDRLRKAYRAYLDQKKMSIAYLSNYRYFQDPRLLYQDIQARLKTYKMRLMPTFPHAIRSYNVLFSNQLRTFLQCKQSIFSKRHQAIVLLNNRLNDLAPSRIIERGFSITKNKDGSIIKSIHKVETGDILFTAFVDGVVESIVRTVSSKKEKDEINGKKK